MMYVESGVIFFSSEIRTKQTLQDSAQATASVATQESASKLGMCNNDVSK